jgi:hypothetical protein
MTSCVSLKFPAQRLEPAGKDGHMANTRLRTGPVGPRANRGNSKLEETCARLPLLRETSITAPEIAQLNGFPEFKDIDVERLTDVNEFARQYADPEYDPRAETERGTSWPSQCFVE